MLKIILWPTLMLWPLLSFSQKKVGDLMEPAVLERELLTAVPPIPLEDIHQKIVIIDFWGSQCGSCIKAMPKMLALQKKYKDEVIILYATEQDSAGVNKVFAKRPDFRKYALPMIRGANFLAMEFPHDGLPHVIWIGKDSRVKAITSSEEVTEKNIETLIHTSTLALKTKNDNIGFDAGLPLLKDDRIPDRNIIRSSMLFSSIDGFGGRISRRVLEGNRVKYLITNQPLASMYSEVYLHQLIIHPYEIRFRILTDKECEKYLDLKDLYCYEYINTIKDPKDRLGFSKLMIADLDHQLSVKSSIRKKELDCFWMNVSKSLSSVTDSSYVLDRIDTVSFFNQPASVIADYIETYYQSDRLIRVPENQTGRISMHFPKRLKDFDQLRSTLKKQGVYFEPGKVVTEIIYLERGLY